MAWWSTIKMKFWKKDNSIFGPCDFNSRDTIRQRQNFSNSTVPTPTTVKELRGFLGLSGYYKRFIWNYGKIAVPLTELLQKEKAFKWTEATAAAFQSLKQALMSAPVLRLPDFKQTFTIETDAFGGDIGAVLLQNGHPITYISKAMGPKYKLLSAYEKEFYAVLFAVKKWQDYLWGQHFIIKTDQKALQHLLL